jgi:nucleotide-binding universal stress UspA family protein
MKHLKQILFPTDFSEPAKGAFSYALQMAKATGANIKVLHIFRGDFGVPVPEIMGYQMLEARRDEANFKMAEFLKLAAVDNYKTVTISNQVEIGLATDVIAEITKKEDAVVDLVIMGTKGEHNAVEVVFGSVTTAVIANASCPVLAIPEGAIYKAVKSIAYASDFKSDNAESLQEAADIAAFLGADLHCVHVYTKAKDKENDLESFAVLTEQISNTSIRIAEIASDTVAHGLDQYVQENGIQLILMSRPHRGLIERLFHRSITKQVALYITKPLMVFRK